MAACAVRVLASCAGQADDSAKALGPSTGCTTPCPGDNTQTCGGSLALNLHALQKAPWLEADSLPGPSLLTGTACVGAAASSDACKKTTPGSAAGAAVVSRVLVAMAAGVAAVALL